MLMNGNKPPRPEVANFAAGRFIGLGVRQAGGYMPNTAWKIAPPFIIKSEELGVRAATCCTWRIFCGSKRKNFDLWAAVLALRATQGVCKVKNRLIGDFCGFMRKAQQTASK
jgi:hypothetical protein